MTTEDAIALTLRLSKRDRSSGHEKPHKPILLLAVLDLIESGAICDNKVIPSQELREAFNRILHYRPSRERSKQPLQSILLPLQARDSGV